MLALLTLRQGAEVERDWLTGLLWPEHTDRQALRNSLTELRRAMGPEAERLRSPTAHTLSLDLSGALVDLFDFDAAIVRGCPASLAEAVALYRGPLLEGCTEEWAFQERQTREETYLGALQKLADLTRARGDMAEAERYLRLAVAVDPLREVAQRRLMEVLAAGGNYAAALLCYRELRLRLHRELNAEPDPETQSLLQRLRMEARRLQQRPTVRTRSILQPPPARSSESTTAHPTDNLPRRSTRFFGRSSEIDRLCTMLRDGETRFVTLTGPGGSGKTSLAQETARRLQAAAAESAAARAPRGRSGLGKGASTACWFVPLLDISDPQLILDKVRDALRLPHLLLEEPLEQIAAFLSGQRSLLVLDNYEHLVEGGAEAVRRLLERVAGLTLLVTSRKRLDLPGERDFPVGPLPVPVESSELRVESPNKVKGAVSSDLSSLDARSSTAVELSTLNSELSTLSQCPSIALFIDRAQAVRPDFQVTPDNAAVVAGLCQRLEGLPLAIELAAARSGVLTPQQMLARLESTLPSGAGARSVGPGPGRFELLVGRQRDADPRHRSLRATMDWSYQLLSPELQRFFARLSVFRGGWTLEAAEAVCEQPRALEYLEELLHCSLVVAEATGEEMRYRLLETLREYGAAQLCAEEQTALAHLHLAYYQTLIEADEYTVQGARILHTAPVLDRMEREHDNLRAAVDWIVKSGDVPAQSRFLPRLGNFWVVRGYHVEGRRRLAEILALPGAAVRTPYLAASFKRAGDMALHQGDLAAGEALVQESLGICPEVGDIQGAWSCSHSLAYSARLQCDFVRSRLFLERMRAAAVEIGHENGAAEFIAEMGYTAYLEGDLATAQSLLEEGLGLVRDSPHQDKENIAGTHMHLGEVADAQGDYPAARAHLEKSLALLVELGDTGNSVLLRMGRVAQHQDQWATARAHFAQSLVIARHEGHAKGIAECLEGLASVTNALGEPERAARLFGAAAALRESRAVPVPPVERADLDRITAAARASLGEAAFAAAWAAGQAMPLDRAIALALEEVPGAHWRAG